MALGSAVGAGVKQGAKPAKPKPAATPIVALSVPVIWAITFLKQIGAPVTPNNVANIIRWGSAESGDPASNTQQYGGWNNYNPLNVVRQAGIPDTGEGGQQGNIANFGDVVSGATASAHLFTTNSNAAGIISALKGNASTSALNNAVSGFYSSWGGRINFTGITPNETGSPAAGSNTAQNLGQGGGNPLGNLLGSLPIVGGLFAGVGNAISAQEGFYSTIIGVFTNWRFVLEVFAGGALVMLGILILLVDTGAAKRGAQVATVAAVA